MADLRLCNELAYCIPLSFFERFGLALDRLEVTFLPADVRGPRHQFNSGIANMCAVRAHTRLRPCEMCRRHDYHLLVVRPFARQRFHNVRMLNATPLMPKSSALTCSTLQLSNLVKACGIQFSSLASRMVLFLRTCAGDSRVVPDPSPWLHDININI